MLSPCAASGRPHRRTLQRQQGCRARGGGHESSHALPTPPTWFPVTRALPVRRLPLVNDDPSSGRRDYLEGHIPGAVFVDVERDLSAPPGAARPASAADRGRLRRGDASRAGIGDERLRRRLRLARRSRAALVAPAPLRPRRLRGARPGGVARPAARRRGDGRARALRAAARGPTTRSAARSLPSADELVVVDARSPPRWRGEPNAVDRVPGRIPGALNAPWNEPLPPLPDGELVAYCGSGVTACVVLHRLHLAGRDGLLFPGSWSEWEQHPSAPGRARARLRRRRVVDAGNGARYRSQRCGIFGVESRMKSTGAGGRGRAGSTIWISCGSRLPLRRLHGAHEVTTFSQVESPPRERGITWSSVSRPPACRSRRSASRHGRRARGARSCAAPCAALGRSARAG